MFDLREKGDWWWKGGIQISGFVLLSCWNGKELPMCVSDILTGFGEHIVCIRSFDILNVALVVLGLSQFQVMTKVPKKLLLPLKVGPIYPLSGYIVSTFS